MTRQPADEVPSPRRAIPSSSSRRSCAAWTVRRLAFEASRGVADAGRPSRRRRTRTATSARRSGPCTRAATTIRSSSASPAGAARGRRGLGATPPATTRPASTATVRRAGHGGRRCSCAARGTGAWTLEGTRHLLRRPDSSSWPREPLTASMPDPDGHPHARAATDTAGAVVGWPDLPAAAAPAGGQPRRRRRRRSPAADGGGVASPVPASATRAGQLMVRVRYATRAGLPGQGGPSVRELAPRARA